MTEPTGMAGFIGALTGEGGLTAANLWGVVVPAGGLIAVAVLFKFGYRFITGIVNGLTNPKKKAVK